MNSISATISDKLFNHPLVKSIKSIDDCKVFMEHHIFAVWDFMSLTKRVQEIFASTITPWQIPPNPLYTRFINEIILAEESDYLNDGRVMSHCQMYLEAMNEIGASTSNFMNFTQALNEHDFHSYEVKQFVPDSAYEFITNTFSVVNSKNPHVVMAGFCYGRENIIPSLFLSILKRIGITNSQAPIFYEYLNKHIELDGDLHGPMAIEMLRFCCNGVRKKHLEAEATQLFSIESRIRFWNGILDSIHMKQNKA